MTSQQLAMSADSGTRTQTSSDVRTAARGRMMAYALWQFRDFALERAIGILVVGFITGWPIVKAAKTIMNDAIRPGILNASFVQWGAVFVPLIAFLAMFRLVSPDRASGSYRFLFSKPVSVPRFYAQLWLVHLVGLVACGVFLYSVAHIFGATFSFQVIVASFAVIGVGVGGFYFLVSVLSRHDLWMGGLVWAMSYMLHMVYGDSGDLRATLVKILPPAHLTSKVTSAAIGGFTQPLVHDILWFAGYGVACYIVGIALLTRRPLST